ncbi:hypothetical protein NIES2107_67330 [Nostoc carneum NIES-2107]|nr:hypothetical protein NIES2107_67330 [Nostoc carneum NIES-2107]
MDYLDFSDISIYLFASLVAKYLLVLLRYTGDSFKNTCNMSFKDLATH